MERATRGKVVAQEEKKLNKFTSTLWASKSTRC